MLVIQQAYEVKASILEYLKATFSFRDTKVGEAFYNFLENPVKGIFKGPYISIKLPYKSLKNVQIPLQIKPSFPPYVHQLDAFERLSFNNDRIPQPTIITTGTGSGKTEAFLYPILDYCFQNTDQSGIKAIILYPMNALASDQAWRIARIIHEEKRLKGITAGLFIGEGSSKKKYSPIMTKEKIIENRDTLIESPPDILLTNFKMLDYALMRARYHDLWRHNINDPSLLRYFVLDELHTYDGVRGTDIANLIRRLKLKLNISSGSICPVGTSATISGGENTKTELSEFAGKVFGETFTEEAIIEESRMEVDDFIGNKELNQFIPDANLLSAKELDEFLEFDDYIRKQLTIWNIQTDLDPISVGTYMKSLQIFKDLLDIGHNSYNDLPGIVKKLHWKNKEFAKIAPESNDDHIRINLVRSLICLIEFSRSGTIERQSPFLNIQVQLWIRELSGVIRKIKPEPEFTWLDEKEEKTIFSGLPAYYCRDCGGSGWIGEKHENKNRFEKDIGSVYEKYFSNHKNIFFFNTHHIDNLKIDDYQPTETRELYLDTDTLIFFDEKSEKRFKIIAYRKTKNNYSDQICPHCNTKNTLSIIGTRVSTLASVTTSQIFSTDFDRLPEKDRKVLAFTNSVQDAAHQAGFIQSRNYRFSFRTALQKVINEMNRSITLNELYDNFIQYWKANADETGKQPLEAYFYKFFPSDHLGDVNVDSFKKGKERFDEGFIHEFDLRLKWQIASEFGYNARIGRTLEKTHSSIAFFNIEKIRLVFNEFKPWLERNSLEKIEEIHFLRFLSGFLQRLRIRGGIDHPYLHKFRTQKSSYFQLTQNVNKQHFLMQNFGRLTRLPKLITNQDNKWDVFDLTTQTGASRNWYHEYFSKSFSDSFFAPYKEIINDFYSELLNILASEDVGLLNCMNAAGINNYAILPEAITVASDVASLRCDNCNNEYLTIDDYVTHLVGMSCLNYRCKGKYQRDESLTEFNYYQKVYARRRTPRIYATDHTGLLERADRELKEAEFKYRPKPNSLNTFVATSTLEMGIDIGDLNTAMNISSPPQPANFIQRVGRAGRSSGSAFIVNFSPKKAHDLFYFENPGSMMAGEIMTPACFLEAKDILRRHFLAFCIDTWTSQNPEKNDIPSLVRHLHLENFKIDDPSFFANRIIQFIKGDEKDLLHTFKSMYKEDVKEDIFSEIEQILINNQFYINIQNSFVTLKEEYDQLITRRGDIFKYIKDKGLTDNDPERIELYHDLKNIRGTLHNIMKRPVLEYLTNLGLLPNYGFPETGVQLNAQVRLKTGLSEGKDRRLKSIELVRPARSALRELAPDNIFYTQGFKLKVSGINIFNLKDEVLDYRFCSNCDHLIQDSMAPTGSCPKCGDASWSSASNVHKFLLLRKVSSYSYEKDAVIDDSAEERDNLIYSITKHLNFNKSSSQGAWALERVPFGIEYFKEVDVREVNTGLAHDTVNRSRTIEIDGKEISASGFIYCKYCGRSSSRLLNERNQPKTALDYHFAYCKNKEVSYKGVNDNLFEEIFLMREIKTEALKILLPVQEFQSEVAVSLFKAGIQLGLRKFYGGNIQHLEFHEYTEFNQKTGKQDKYLVLLDNIPGGTGYLGKLFNNNEFRKVIEMGAKAISECDCKNQEKDGCYRCIYTYGNQFEREMLSRKAAEELFAKLLTSIGSWNYCAEGLGDLTSSGKIEESELEERFIALLGNYFNSENKKENGCSFTSVKEDGVLKYLLSIKNKAVSILYEIRPQVNLGALEPIPFPTRADFLITCLDYQIDDISVPEFRDSILPITIYMDGYQYHATKENNRFLNDIEKRRGVLSLGKFFTWTLSWYDLDLFEKEFPDLLYETINGNKDTLKQIKKHPEFKNEYIEFSQLKDNFSRLIWLLANIQRFNGKYINHFLSRNQSSFGRYPLSVEHKDEYCHNEEKRIEDYPLLKTKDAFLFLDSLISSEQLKYRLFIGLVNLKPSGTILLAENTDGYPKEDWQYFWQLFNLLQFPDDQVRIISQKESDDHEITDEVLKEEEILLNFDPKYHLLVKEILLRNISFNREHYFAIEDQHGIITAEAFLGLPDKKIVIDPLDKNASDLFVEKGYTVYELENFNINSILS